MTNKFYIEDIFVQFYATMQQYRLGMQPHDLRAASSFNITLLEGKDITEKQAAYILKILTKYRNTCSQFYDYRDLLENPAWSKPFRTVDNRKLVWVEKDELTNLWICLKFPFAFKEIFDEQFAKTDEYMNATSLWDSQNKVRKLYFYDFNFVNLIEFFKKHEFEIQDSAVEALSAVEEIWNNQDHYLKTSKELNGKISLVNAETETQDYFDKNKTDIASSDLILAKNIGHIYSGKKNTIWKQIAGNKTNTFHCRDMQKFLKICYGVEGKVIIMLDKPLQNSTDHAIDWVKELSHNISLGGYDKTDFRVCFRPSNKTDKDFNEWVSENGFGGKIDTAKFLIFREKPAKWLFKDEKDVIIVATNELLPGLNSHGKSMLKSHPCVIYIGDFKPVTQYGETIVEL